MPTAAFSLAAGEALLERFVDFLEEFKPSLFIERRRHFQILLASAKRIKVHRIDATQVVSLPTKNKASTGSQP